MKREDLSLNSIESVLEYSPKTGVFMWRPQEAGHKRKDNGYVSITVHGVEVKAHQLAWFMTYGKWPNGLIDHINGDTSDNMIENLRDATHKINAQNQREAQVHNRSKLLGVAWHKRSKKWQAGIRHEGRYRYLGLFESEQEAHGAYLVAKRFLHEGCTI